jgi:trk system potassium uptake protein TrkA
MRILIIGAGSVGDRTTRMLIARGHELVLVDQDQARMDALAGELDCGLIRGDGTRPAVLKEVDPERVDALLCLTGSDQTNLIAGLVGRSLGIDRVITRVDDDDFEHIAVELGLTEVVIPGRATSRYLADHVEGHDHFEIGSAIKGDARIFFFVVQDETSIQQLGLPAESRVMHFYRDGAFLVPDENTTFEKGDEVAVVTHRKNLDRLRELFGSHPNAASS